MAGSDWGNFLVFQWVGLQAFTAEGPGSISGPGTKTLQTLNFSFNVTFWRGRTWLSNSKPIAREPVVALCRALTHVSMS